MLVEQLITSYVFETLSVLYFISRSFFVLFYFFVLIWTLAPGSYFTTHILHKEIITYWELVRLCVLDSMLMSFHFILQNIWLSQNDLNCSVGNILLKLSQSFVYDSGLGTKCVVDNIPKLFWEVVNLTVYKGEDYIVYRISLSISEQGVEMRGTRLAWD